MTKKFLKKKFHNSSDPPGPLPSLVARFVSGRTFMNGHRSRWSIDLYKTVKIMTINSVRVWWVKKQDLFSETHAEIVYTWRVSYMISSARPIVLWLLFSFENLFFFAQFWKIRWNQWLWVGNMDHFCGPLAAYFNLALWQVKSTFSKISREAATEQEVKVGYKISAIIFNTHTFL